LAHAARICSVPSGYFFPIFVHGFPFHIRSIPFFGLNILQTLSKEKCRKEKLILKSTGQTFLNSTLHFLVKLWIIRFPWIFMAKIAM
jgi:hypothetical protein